MKIAFALVLVPLLHGGKACEPCHAAIYRSYASTPMAKSSGPGVDAPVSFENASFGGGRSVFTYLAGRDGAGFFFRLEKPGSAPVVGQLPYFIGSGASASAFLISVDGFLYEAPVTYYGKRRAWDFSPGYQEYSYPFLTRAVGPRCLECHAGQLQPIAATQNGYESPPFLEKGIACKRCHGAEEAHLREPKRGNIVNPARLDAERRDSVCMECHLSGDVRIERAGTFTPGGRFSQAHVAFVRPGASGAAKVTGHVESLAQSVCKQAAGDRLWCGTCHDAHFVPAAADKASYFRAKCLTCHAAEDCKNPAGSRGDCISCHMPREPASDAEHVVRTNHAIRRRPAALGKSGDMPVPFGNRSATQRELGLAYAMLAIRERNDVYASRAFELLKQAVIETPNDSQTLSYLADLFKKRREDAAAIALYERLLRADPADVTAPVALGGYRLQQGGKNEAIRLWRSALSKNPALLLVRVNLAALLMQTGDVSGARAVLSKALEFNPNFQAALDLLKTIP